MPHFLLDKRLLNVTVTEELLVSLNTLFESRWHQALKKEENKPDKDNFLLSYVIRFDEKGYKVFSIEELLKHFNEGKKIERIICTLESFESIKTNRQNGSVVEIRLDSQDQNSCFLTISSNDNSWVDTSYSEFTNAIFSHKNFNGIARNEWTSLLIQIFGVSLGFLLSLWAATKISPSLNVENSFIISFLFFLLIFSNTWTYLNRKLFEWINRLFPNLKFYRPQKDRLHWLIQATIGGISSVLALYILNLLFTYLKNIVEQLSK